MTYKEDAELYRDPEFRERGNMCVREQGYIFSADGRPDIAALGRGVSAGNLTDIDAVLAAIVVAPGTSDLEEDGALLSATQTVWPTVAASRYPNGEPITKLNT